jgi:hypothetical protein
MRSILHPKNYWLQVVVNIATMKLCCLHVALCCERSYYIASKKCICWGSIATNIIFSYIGVYVIARRVILLLNLACGHRAHGPKAKGAHQTSHRDVSVTSGNQPHMYAAPTPYRPRQRPHDPTVLSPNAMPCHRHRSRQQQTSTRTLAHDPQPQFPTLIT